MYLDISYLQDYRGFAEVPQTARRGISSVPENSVIRLNSLRPGLSAALTRAICRDCFQRNEKSAGNEVAVIRRRKSEISVVEILRLEIRNRRVAYVNNFLDFVTLLITIILCRWF